MTAKCGATESLTASTENIDADARYDLRVGQDVNIALSVLNGAEGTLSIDEATPLPAGLRFENNAIVGKPEKDVVVRINVLLTNGTNVSGKIVELAILPANGEAGDLSPKKKGCFGDIGPAIALTSLFALAFGCVVAVKGLRKKEER